MKKHTFPIRLLLISIFLILGLSLTSCGWKPSEEEIRSLEETRTAALDAERTQQEKKAEADDLQNQVDSKKAELEKVKTEKSKVEAAVTERHSDDSK